MTRPYTTADENTLADEGPDEVPRDAGPDPLFGGEPVEDTRAPR